MTLDHGDARDDGQLQRITRPVKTSFKTAFKTWIVKLQHYLSAPSLISPSCQGGPTIFIKGNPQTHPFFKKCLTYEGGKQPKHGSFEVERY